MPISIQVTDGLLTAAGEQQVLPMVAAALLRVHGLAGNPFMTPNVVGHVVISSESLAYVGGKPQSLAVVEVKVPAITFPNAEVKQEFVSAVTNIIDQLKAGAHPIERTYVNVTYAVEDAWGIAGKAYSHADLVAAIQQTA